MSSRTRIELRRSRATARTTDAVFATLCDLSLTPTWLPNCTGLELVDQAELGAGARLRYSFREYGYTGSLPCSVTAFVPGQRLAIAFTDPRVEASFDFELDHHDGVTTIHHHVALLPTSLAVRLVAGMIRRGLPARMDAALRGLELAASSPPSASTSVAR